MSCAVQLFGNVESSIDIVQIPARRPVDEMGISISIFEPGSTLGGSTGMLIETSYGSTMVRLTVCSSLSNRD